MPDPSYNFQYPIPDSIATPYQRFQNQRRGDGTFWGGTQSTDYLPYGGLYNPNASYDNYFQQAQQMQQQYFDNMRKEYDRRSGFSYQDDNGMTHYNWNNIAAAGLGLAQAGTGLANVFLGFQNARNARDQLAFQKHLAARNWEQQTKLINQSQDNYAAAAADLKSGSYDPVSNTYSRNSNVANEVKQRGLERHLNPNL